MRLGRLGHDPLARPAPITCGDAPKRKPEEAPAPNPKAKPAIASFASLTPEQRAKGGRNGNSKASALPHNWPKVIAAIITSTGWTAKQFSDQLNVNQSTVSNWRSGNYVPTAGKHDRAIVALYAKHVGGPLP
jgi:DNA-binding transcriptional regulator YiaG